MYKSLFYALTLTFAGMVLCGISLAQQSSAPPTNPPAAATATPTASTPQKTPAAKAGTTAGKKEPAPLVLKTDKDKASYAMGTAVGTRLKDNFTRDGVDLDPDILARGLRDVLAGNELLLTNQDAQAILTALQNDVNKRQKELHDAALAKNAQAGEAFLAANKTKDDVVTLPSGLQYKILQPGTGAKPTATDTVVCNYRGTHLDGTEFDSSYKRGQAAKFPVSGVIKGWTEALLLMPVGSKWEIFIPSSLAYGETGTPRGGPIGPNETLIFDVELISVQPNTPAPAQPKALTQP